jgi:DNA gyrase subunit A
MIREDEDLLLINSSGVVIRTPAESIRQCGRASQGVILIRLDEGDKVISGTCAKREEEEETSVEAVQQPEAPIDAE